MGRLLANQAPNPEPLPRSDTRLVGAVMADRLAPPELLTELARIRHRQDFPTGVPWPSTASSRPSGRTPPA